MPVGNEHQALCLVGQRPTLSVLGLTAKKPEVNARVAEQNCCRCLLNNANAHPIALATRMVYQANSILNVVS